MTDVALPPVASAAPRRQVAAWALWDWGSAAFNAVMVTFVFGTYLASDAFGPDERGTAWLSTALAIKPILRLTEGKIALAAKTRTQHKAMEKMVEMVTAVVTDEVQRAAEAGTDPRTVKVAVQQVSAVEVAEKLVTSMRENIACTAAAAEDAAKESEAPAPKIPEVDFELMEASEVLAIHSGPGAIAVSTVLW